MNRLALAASLLCSCTYITISPPPPEDPMCIEPPAIAATVHIIYSVRLSRRLVSLSPQITQLQANLASAIMSRGALVTHTVAMPLVAEPHAPGAIYFESCETPPPQPLGETLRYYGTSMTSNNKDTCELQMLADVGPTFETLQPSYPGELLGGQLPPMQTAFFNERVPTYVVVVVIDPQEREHDYDECQSAKAFTREGPGGVDWLRYAFGSLPPERVYFLTVATSERGEGATAFSEECLNHAGFPAAAIDSLSPSPKTFFTDFTGAFVRELPDQATLLDFCDAISANGSVRMGDFVHEIHKRLGLPG